MSATLGYPEAAGQESVDPSLSRCRATRQIEKLNLYLLILVRAGMRFSGRAGFFDFCRSEHQDVSPETKSARQPDPGREQKVRILGRGAFRTRAPLARSFQGAEPSRRRSSTRHPNRWMLRGGAIWPDPFLLAGISVENLAR